MTPPPEDDRVEKMRAHRRAYWERFRETRRHTYGTVPKAEYDALEARAKAGGRSVWDQLHHESQGYNRGEYVPPEEVTKSVEALLVQLSQNHAYTPLSRVHGYTDAERVAHIIAKRDGGAHTEPVWEDGAKRLIRILIRTLKNYEANGAPPATLAEVIQHLNAFDAHLPESRLHKWVSAGTLKDPQTWQDFQGFTQEAPEKMMLSFVSTATTTLAPVGNPELATLLSGDDFDFAALKDRPTALFIKVHQQDMQLFGFVLSLFFTDLINQLLHNRAGRVPVWLFLDEFGHMTIPGFSTFATTARKYNVGFWLFVQSLSQLRERYGDYGAETILGGLGTETYFGGVGLDTAHNLSRRFGDAFHVDLLALDKGVHQRPLMRPDEIIRLRDNRMLLLHGNRHPVRVSVLPFFKRGDLRQKAKILSPKSTKKGLI